MSSNALLSVMKHKAHTMKWVSFATIGPPLCITVCTVFVMASAHSVTGLVPCQMHVLRLQQRQASILVVSGIDRARAIFVHASTLANPRVDHKFWLDWKQFEVAHGNEDTFREMLRIQRHMLRLQGRPAEWVLCVCVAAFPAAVLLCIIICCCVKFWQRGHAEGHVRCAPTVEQQTGAMRTWECFRAGLPQKLLLKLAISEAHSMISC
eukprot:1161160-Pelagomonas_calceolata.AAC.4